jgi:AcrR family transcriptional regulator
VSTTAPQAAIPSQAPPVPQTAVILAPLATLPKWRSDLDPRAMPDTPSLTSGQRNVLQAALVLFADKGFPASSIRDIAQEAGMRSASLYAHFASKDAILAELVRIGYKYHVESVLAAVEGAPVDPREQLHAAVHAHVLLHCEYSQLGIVTTNEFKHVPEQMRVGLRSIVATQVSTVVIEILSRGAQQGLFLPTGHHVMLLAMASMGVDAARWYPYQTDIDAKQLAKDFADLTIRMATV